tara:strand:+ start:29635 stop:30093 length:459 start_codon:yes stop_codon:yes gene_type:complete
MSWWNPLSWGDKAADNVLDKDKGLAVKFGGFVNDLHYSDAEKAKDNQTVIEFAMQRLKLLEPFKIVQRVIAGATLFLWLFVGLNVCVSIWVHAATKEIKIIDGKEVVTSIDARTDFLEFAFSDYVFWPVICVFTLYCGGGVARYFRKDNQTD